MASCNETMTCEDFKTWLQLMGYTQQQAAEQLGVSKRTINYRVAGTFAPTRTEALACSALAAGIDTWEKEWNRD